MVLSGRITLEEPEKQEREIVEKGGQIMFRETIAERYIEWIAGFVTLFFMLFGASLS